MTGAGYDQSVTSTLPPLREPGAVVPRRGPRSGNARHARARTSWFEPLFPMAERSAMSPWIIGVLYAASFVGLTALALARQSGVPATNSVWAEDGAIFYQQERLYGFAHTLTMPYNGYLQLGPRLLVQFTRLGSTADVAAIMAVTGASIVALVCLYVFHASRGFVPAIWIRLVLVGVIVLLPLATGEILDNNVNIGWWLFFAAFWALITRPRTTMDAVVAAVVTLLATGTEPLVALLVPLAVVRLLVFRTQLRQLGAVIGLLAGLAYQGIGAIQTHGGQSTFSTATAHGVLPSFGVRVGWGWLSGDHFTFNILAGDHRIVWQVTGYLLLACILGLPFLFRDRATTMFVVTAVVFALVTYVVPVVFRGAGPNELGPPVFAGSRYSATPVLLVWSAVLVEFARLDRLLKGRRLRYAPALLCLALLVPVWSLDFRQPNLRTSGPAWSQQVATAKASCQIHPHKSVHLQISPGGWQVVLPCRDVS